MKTYYVAGIPFSSELYHHGIKGQKWGVRRFQNLDRTLTPAGKERYYGKNFSTNKQLQERFGYKENYDYSDEETRELTFMEAREKYRKSMLNKPGLGYRDKYGQLTEEGKEKERERHERAYVYGPYENDDGSVNWEAMTKDFGADRETNRWLQYNDNEEKRVKALFDKSPDPKMRDPKFQQKILDTWSKALFAEYDGDYSGVSKREVDKLNKLEKAEIDAHKRSSSSQAHQQWAEDKISWEQYRNSKGYKDYEKAYNEYRKQLDRVGGSIKMRTMNEIMKEISPELREAVYEMMSDNWYYD